MGNSKTPAAVELVYLDNYNLKKWGPLRTEKPDDVGKDLRSTIYAALYPGKRILIPNGIKVAIPTGYAGFVCPRSGLANKHGITVLNTPGTIDPGFRGEVCTILYNGGGMKFEIDIGMRISQLLIWPIPEVEFFTVTQLSDSERGSGGFGHTGF